MAWVIRDWREERHGRLACQVLSQHARQHLAADEGCVTIADQHRLWQRFERVDGFARCKCRMTGAELLFLYSIAAAAAKNSLNLPGFMPDYHNGSVRSCSFRPWNQFIDDCN